jgi:hypothetical protein
VVIDRSKVAAEERLDGKCLLSNSEPDVSAEDIALGYKHLLEAERGFRDMSTLELRPVFHRLSPASVPTSCSAGSVQPGILRDCPSTGHRHGPTLGTRPDLRPHQGPQKVWTHDPSPRLSAFAAGQAPVQSSRAHLLRNPGRQSVN